nr:hypothetical protein [uncultured Rhodopila sp.]
MTQDEEQTLPNVDHSNETASIETSANRIADDGPAEAGVPSDRQSLAREARTGSLFVFSVPIPVQCSYVKASI